MTNFAVVVERRNVAHAIAKKISMEIIVSVARKRQIVQATLMASRSAGLKLD